MPVSGRACSRSIAASAPGTRSSGMCRFSASWRQHGRGVRLSRIADHARRAAGYQLNQLPTEQLSLGTALTPRVNNPYFGIIPRSSSLGDPTIPYNQLLRAVPAVHVGQHVPQQHGDDQLSGFSAKLEQRLSRGLSYLVSYTRSRLRTMPRPCSTHRFSPDPWPTTRWRTASIGRASATTRPVTSLMCSPSRRFG